MRDSAAQQGAEADKVREGACVRGPCSLAPVLGGLERDAA
jgi:hypothetical protein